MCLGVYLGNMARRKRRCRVPAASEPVDDTRRGHTQHCDAVVLALGSINAMALCRLSQTRCFAEALRIREHIHIREHVRGLLLRAGAEDLSQPVYCWIFVARFVSRRPR
jgi:hypothetical protein